jgi:aspartyl-tRNA(Asn)/glutamyl-tRNA(Gln) amidotransferase subunit A
MTVHAWLQAAIADAESRGLPQLAPLLEGLGESVTRLREATFNDTAEPRAVVPDGQSRDRRAQPPPHPSATTTPLPTAGSAERSVNGAPSTLTIAEFGRRLRAGGTSSLETTEACLQAIAARNATLNAFILVTADEARARARQADEELAAGHDRGPLHGVPLSLKDLFDVRGAATTAASRVRRGDMARSDASAVVHLRHAGAVIVGKTNLHEFAFGTTNEDSGFGAAYHPVDLTRSPGGSSGGSAASVAAGMALGTLGTDTGGSIRIPSAACGLVGLKPTIDELATDGVVPLSHTLDHVGPLAHTVIDAWYLYQALLGRPVARALNPSPLAGLRVGVPRRYFCDLLEPAVRERFDHAVEVLERAGARVSTTDIAHADDIAAVYLLTVLAEAAAYHAATLESTPELYTPPVRLRLEMARYVLGEDYLRALAGRETLRREVDAALSWHDVLVLPTLPILAPPLGATTLTIGDRPYPVRTLMLRLTQLFNITGHPAVSLPCGMSAEGLPIGLQLIGRRHETDVLMHVALGVERALSA